MRTPPCLLFLGLTFTLAAGCSSSRMSLTKSDPPKASQEEVRVKYGNPWAKPKPEKKISDADLPPELAAKLKTAKGAAKERETEAALALAPLLRKAAEAEGKGDRGTAKDLYQQVLKQDSKNAEAHHRLAVIADQQQDSKTADDHYARALALQPSDADLLSDIGFSLYLRGRFDDAARRLKEALEADQFHRGAHSNLGLVYGRQGRYDDALAEFRLAGTESEAQRNLAQLFPNGRPGSGNSSAGSLPAIATSERKTAPAMPADIDQKQFANMSVNDVRRLMEQERQSAERQRAQAQRQELRPQMDDITLKPESRVAMAPPAGPANNPMPTPNGLYGAAPATSWPATNPANTAAADAWATPNAGAAPPNVMTPSPNQAAPMNPATAWGQPNSSGNPVTGAPGMSTTPTNGSRAQDPTAYWPANPPPKNTVVTAVTPSAGAPWMPSLPNIDPNSFPPPGTMPNGMTPSPNNPWGQSPPGMMAPNGAAVYGGRPSDILPVGGAYEDPATMARPTSSLTDAHRLAAQMAMGTGPGGLLPVITPGPSATPASPRSNVRWAYGEGTGDPNAGQMMNAVWTTPPNESAPVHPAANWNMTTPGANAAPPSVAPPAPWSDWKSPAPPPIQWSTDAATNPNTPPAWPGNAGAVNNGAPASNTGNLPPTWPGAENNASSSAPITIPNWPNAPSRP